MMQRIILTLMLIVFITSAAWAGNGNDDKSTKSKSGITTCSLTGCVVDQESSEKLVCAKIEVEGTDISVFTDILGNFEIPALKPGTYNLKISYISYEEKAIANLVVDKQKDLIIDLKPL